jgi:adenylate cyclase class IV
VGHPLGAAGAVADEIEVNAIVPDPDALHARLAAAGARLVLAGHMEDRRYDTADAALARRDEVLRLRTARPGPAGHGAARASLDWKGPTRLEGGYKVREEHSTPVGDPAVVALVLARLGLRVTREVDREVAEYELGEGPLAAALRVERYPRMDVLLEVEGRRRPSSGRSPPRGSRARRSAPGAWRTAGSPSSAAPGSAPRRRAASSTPNARAVPTPHEPTRPPTSPR